MLTCFPVKPRRRRYESEVSDDRKAFRLCIAATDRDRLLDESKWPESIVISEWYHINPAVRTQRGSEQVTMDRPVIPVVEVANPPVNDCTVVYDAAAGAASSSHMESVDDIPTVDYGGC